MAPILTVFGATGVQGGSVVDAALKDGKFTVRAITRNVNSEKAKALAARGVETVTADLNDISSLEKAFVGTTAIYAVTDFFEPFAASGPEHAMKVEVAQGINVAKAASSTPTLKHYIWSTLPNGSRISNGKYVIPHFEAKNKIDDYIKSDAALLAKTTFLWVTFYPTNYFFPIYTPNFNKTSGKYMQLQPVGPDTLIRSIGDTSKNVGIFALSILNQPHLTQGGKFVLADVETTTIGEMLKTWSVVTGKPSVYVQTKTLEDFDAVWPSWGEEIGNMMLFWEEAGEKSWSGEPVILTRDDLAIGEEMVGFAETFRNIDWSSV